VREDDECVVRLLMSVGIGVGSVVHGSQDLYPTYLEKTKGLTNDQATIVAMIGACGAIVCVCLAHTSLHNNFINTHWRTTVVV
jgi:hypothetical protein